MTTAAKILLRKFLARSTVVIYLLGIFSHKTAAQATAAAHQRQQRWKYRAKYATELILDGLCISCEIVCADHGEIHERMTVDV